MRLAADIPRRLIVAVGGNAIDADRGDNSPEAQKAIAARTAQAMLPLLLLDNQLVITHGNGPVVGNILFRMAHTSQKLPPMPMDVCVSHSQGGMGYMLQQSLANVLHRHGMPLGVSAVVTEVEVDPRDPAFTHPTKPVGKFFDEDDAKRIAAETGWTFDEDSGRGWRRIVPSPMPLKILDAPAIGALLAAGIIPIAAGGGGIPVAVAPDGTYHGVEAVIDKDLTSRAADCGAGTAGDAHRRRTRRHRLPQARAAGAAHGLAVADRRYARKDTFRQAAWARRSTRRYAFSRAVAVARSSPASRRRCPRSSARPGPTSFPTPTLPPRRRMAVAASRPGRRRSPAGRSGRVSRTAPRAAIGCRAPSCARHPVRGGEQRRRALQRVRSSPGPRPQLTDAQGKKKRGVHPANVVRSVTA